MKKNIILLMVLIVLGCFFPISAEKKIVSDDLRERLPKAKKEVRKYIFVGMGITIIGITLFRAIRKKHND